MQCSALLAVSGPGVECLSTGDVIAARLRMRGVVSLHAMDVSATSVRHFADESEALIDNGQK